MRFIYRFSLFFLIIFFLRIDGGLSFSINPKQIFESSKNVLLDLKKEEKERIYYIVGLFFLFIFIIIISWRFFKRGRLKSYIKGLKSIPQASRVIKRLDCRFANLDKSVLNKTFTQINEDFKVELKIETMERTILKGMDSEDEDISFVSPKFIQISSSANVDYSSKVSREIMQKIENIKEDTIKTDEMDNINYWEDWWGRV